MSRTLKHQVQRRGAITLLTGFLMVVLVAAAAFTVDLAYMHFVRTELQSASDAAARAATYALGTQQDTEAARQAAIQYALANSVAGKPLQLSEDDIVFGRSDIQEDGSFSFTPDMSPFNTVQIRGRRTNSSLSGPVALFLGPMLGVKQFEPIVVARASRLDRDICIVVDRSGSMAWDESDVAWQYPAEYQSNSWQENYVTPPHPTGSRWAGLAEAVDVFREAVDDTAENEYIGLVSYSNEYTYNGVHAETVTTHVELSDTAMQLSEAIADIGSEPIIGGTNIGAGLDRGIQVVTDETFSRPYAFKMIVLMTDGVWNAGTNPVVVAEDAVAQNIVVHTVTFSAGANQADMISIADLTGGEHYHAPTREELKDAFEKIAYSLPVIITQ